MYHTLVIIHASLGGIALLAGSIAALSRKGSKNHIRAGRVFALSMFLSAASAVVLTSMKPNPFLLGIALFTGYMIVSGMNWIMRISMDSKLRRAKMIGALGISSAIFMGYSSFSDEEINVVLLVFTIILSIMAIVDIVRSPQPDKTPALHGGRMGGAFIAAVTAFVVVNLDFLPGLLLWLGPTVIGSPLIALGIRNFYKKKQG